MSGLRSELFGAPIKTVVHGYDYPWPDGRGFWGGHGPLPGPWLKPAFDRKAITGSSSSIDTLKVRRALMRGLLVRYNEMLESVVGNPGLDHVVYVDLRGVLDATNYKDDWANELHPTRSGFATIAERIDEVLPRADRP